MNKKEIIKKEISLSKELVSSLESIFDILEENGWELSDEGDIVEKKSKRLVWEIYNGFKKD